MTHNKLIVCYIATLIGPRFSIHPNEEEFRLSLVDYFEEVFDESPLPEGISLEGVIAEIEEYENVYYEETIIDPESFWQEG